MPLVVSLRFGGVRFVVYSNDHPPRHVHGFSGDTEAIVDLRRNRTVALAKRGDPIRPANAKRSEVKRSCGLQPNILTNWGESNDGT